MKVAAIYDLHGNVPALEAVLGEIRREDAGLLVVGGDIFPGPMPRGMLKILLTLEIPTEFIRGNGDLEALAAMAGKPLDRVPEPYRGITRWSAMQVYPEFEELIAGWPKTFETEIEGIGRVLFCHATPRDEYEIFTKNTPEADLLPVFAGADADLVVCGHTHMQFDRRIGRMRVVNAGSLGMPFGEPLANWLLIDAEKIELRRTAYDLEQAAARIRQTEYPQAEDFAANSILNPPSEKEMLKLFDKVKLK